MLHGLDFRVHDMTADATTYGINGSREQNILVTDIISEGPIAGLVEGGKSIFLNNDSLLNVDIAPYIAPQGQTITLNSGSATGTVNLNNTTFAEVLTADYGKKYLNIWGAYAALKATMSAKPEPAYRSDGSTPVINGWKFSLSRTSGPSMLTAWNHPDADKAFGTTTTWKITDGSTRATLSTGSSPSVKIQGVFTGVTANGTDFEFRSKDGRLESQLIKAADYNGSTEHTIYIHRFFEIASISGTTITLANNSPISVTKRFGITSPQPQTSTHTGATASVAAKKYAGTDFSFTPGDVDQEPLVSLDGIGSSSVVLSQISTASLEKDAASIITSTGVQASLIDEVKILIAYPQGLYALDEGDGDKFSAGAGYKVEIQLDRDGFGDFMIIEGNQSVGGTSVFGHGGDYRTAVTFEFRIGLEEFQPFNGFKIRITRLTQHDFNAAGGVPRYGSLTLTGNDEHKIIGTAQLQAVTGLIKEKLNFPYTAYANVKLNSKTFNNMPTRTYECYGLKVKVPSNYQTREENDGVTATQKRNTSTGVIESSSQFWDGQFRDDLVYTDNPAWIFYDILTNNRYGLGQYLQEQDIDKYSLYKIARYCDELVPDGLGGEEPRFRANLYLTKATDAYKVMKDVATIFRGMLYWADSKFFAVIDERKEPIFNFSRSNVIDGVFSYESTGDKTRVNQIIVEWNNPDGDYKLEPIIVEDAENQIKTKQVRSERAIAFGCTSYGQALRYGRWKLWTSINQTEIVTFSTAMDASFLTPGDIINIQDDVDYEVPFSGRVYAYNASGPTITLDRDISSHFAGGYTYDIAVILPKRTILLNQDSATITTSGGNVNKVRGNEITEATVAGAAKTLIHSTTGTVNGAVNNSVNVTLDSSNSLITIGDTVTGLGITRTITVANISGTSLTLSIAQTIADDATLTFENSDTTRLNISSAVDSSGAFLNLQYEESTIVEERRLTTGSTTTSAGRNTIPLSSAFSVAATAGAIWAIKQISTSTAATTASSYKEYKILSIAELNKSEFAMVAVEYYEGKFSAVDDVEFVLDAEDPLYPPEPIQEVPMPKNLHILREPDFRFSGEELSLVWDAPDPAGSSGVSTTYEHLAEYEISHTFGKNTAESPITVSSEQRSYSFAQVPNGLHNIGVRAISGKGRRSARAYVEIQVDDIFNAKYNRVWGGIIKGGYVSSDVSISNAGSDKGTFKFNINDYVAAPFRDVKIAKRNTTADADTTSIVLTALASGSYPQQVTGTTIDWGYVFMDFSLLDASSPNANPLKLIAYKSDTTTYQENITYWYDVIKFLADADSIWTSVGNVNVTKGSVKVTASSSIFSGLKIPETIKIGSSFAGKVAYVESGTVLYLDRPWLATSATSQALSKQELDIDYRNDFVIASVAFNASGTDDDGNAGSYRIGGGNGGNSYISLMPELEKQGRSIVIESDVQFLEYNSSSVQQNASDINLTLRAVGFQSAQFQITGAGFAEVSTAATATEFADITVTNNTATVKIHETDDQATIDYDNAAILPFTITAREKEFPNNVNRQATATFNLGKIREGSQGNSTALIYLYKTSANNPGASDIDSNFPTVTVTLSGTNAGTITGISAGSISGAGQIASTGWFKTPQDPGNALTWVVAATANGSGTSDDIGYTEWSDPIQFTGSDGVQGVAGLNSATVEIYKRTNSTSESTKPIGNTTYTFDPVDVSFANPNGWSTAASSPIQSAQYVWKRTAAAVANTDTDVIGDTEWSTAIISAQYGAEGSAGRQNFVGTLFYGGGIISGQAAPGAPSGGTFTFATKAFSGGSGLSNSLSTTAWSFAAPTFDPYDGSDNQLVWYACTIKAIEETSLNGTATGGNLTFTDVHAVHSFNGVVAFTDLSASSGSTVIHGSRITTGSIAGPGYNSTGNGASGAKIVLDTASIGNTDAVIDVTSGTTSKFKVTKEGNLTLSGTINASNFTGTSTIEGTNNILTVGADGQITIDGSNQRILITDGSNTRVRLGKLTD